jgi:hypothetical protein
MLESNERMGGLKRVQTEDEFASILRAERAILFFWVPWAIHSEVDPIV